MIALALAWLGGMLIGAYLGLVVGFAVQGWQIDQRLTARVRDLNANLDDMLGIGA